MDYLEINPKVMLGKPIIKGTRISVEQIIQLMASGFTMEMILKEYKGIKIEAIQECLLYASRVLDKTSVFELNKIAS